MSTSMRLAAALELAATILEGVFHVRVMPATCTHLEQIAFFLAVGFIITELAAAWHIMIKAKPVPSPGSFGKLEPAFGPVAE